MNWWELMEMSCEGCAWYYEPFGTCYNADSKYCADTPTHRCELYEKAEEDGNDVPCDGAL